MLRDSGRFVSIDHLGGDVTDRADADATVRAYLELLGRLGSAANHPRRPPLGSPQALGAGPGAARDSAKIALDNARHLHPGRRGRGLGHRRRRGSHHHRFDLVHRAGLRTEFDWLGTVLQAYLRRTGRLPGVRGRRARIRLCKGAYDEPESVAHRDPAAVTANYLSCLRVLMAGSGYPDGGLHDRSSSPPSRNGRPDRAHRRRFRVPDANGIRDPEQRRLAQEGSHVRVYVPYGSVVRVLRAPAGRAAGKPDVLPARSRRAVECAAGRERGDGYDHVAAACAEAISVLTCRAANRRAAG